MKKWKNIRDNFVREFKKTKKRSGDKAPPYIPKWKYYTALLFLRDTVRHSQLVNLLF